MTRQPIGSELMAFASAKAFSSLRHRHLTCADSHPFNNPKITFRAGGKRLKRLFVCLAFASRRRPVIALEFDNDCQLWHSSFVGLPSLAGPVKRRPPNDSITGIASAA